MTRLTLQQVAAVPRAEDEKNFLIRTLRELHSFIFFRIDPFVIGVYRVYLGLFVLSFYLLLAPNWLNYYGPQGIAQEPVLSNHTYRLFDSPLRYCTTDLQMWLFYGLTIMFAIMLTAGVLTRISVIWIWMTVFSLATRNRFTVNGEEQILALLLIFSIFMPLDAALPRQYLFRRGGLRKILYHDEKVRVWSLTPLQVQMVLVYLLSFPHKLFIPNRLADGTVAYTWRDGTAVYYAMMNMNYTRWPGIELFAWHEAIISRILTWSTLLIEGLVPLLIWTRRFRVLCVFGCIGLHVSLAALLSGVVMFNGAMIAAFLLFLPSRQTRLLCQHLVYGEQRISAVAKYTWGTSLEPIPASS